jgi:hypothetical protein
MMRGAGAGFLKRSLVAAGAAALLLCTAALAQQPTQRPSHKPTSLAAPLRANPDWQSLTPAQRSALAPLEHDWSGIDADRKEKWLEVAAKFPKMSPDERQRVQARMAQWARLSPKERGEARLHYQELRQMSPAERQARWEQYQALPPDQRRQLAARAAPASAPERTNGRAGRAAAAASAPVPKSNIVSSLPPPTAAVKPVAPTVVQAKPGATTTLMSKPANPPAHQQPGLPKVAATPGFVDRTTLLPQKGAQAAGTRAPAASAPARP